MDMTDIGLQPHLGQPNIQASASLSHRAQTDNPSMISNVGPSALSSPTVNTTASPKYKNPITPNSSQAQSIQRVRSRREKPSPPSSFQEPAVAVDNRTSAATINSNDMSQSTSASTLIGSVDQLYAAASPARPEKHNNAAMSSLAHQVPLSTNTKDNHPTITNQPIPQQSSGLFHRPSMSSALPYRNNTSHSIVDYQYYRKGGSSIHSANEFLQSLTAKTSFNSRMSEINRRNYWKFGKEKILFLAVNAVFTLAGASIFVLTMFSWSDANWYGPIVRIAQPDVLGFSTAIGILILGMGLIGFIGAFSHNKTMVGLFTLTTVPTFILIIVTLYVSFKWINDSRWEQNFASRYTTEYSNQTRLLIQNKFSCCGFYAAGDESVVYDGIRCIEGVQWTFDATLGENQFDQPVLPQPCYEPFNDFTHAYLRSVYIGCIGLLPLTLLSFVAGILATNHIYD
ncbi:hypothetical protein SeMB42_g05637 [Synchytrium endobioticum]|nr:hypothetical protein SeMB42_g05637 [Synchytrium endobioticum]